MNYVREDKSIEISNSIEAIFIELNLPNKKWLLC